MATAVKCEGNLHGSCWNSPVMSFSCSIRGPCCGSVLLLICLCIPPSRTAEAARASAPFNLRPAPRSPRGSHGRTCWANSSFPFVHTRKLTDLIRWLPSLWWRLCHVTRISISQIRYSKKHEQRQSYFTCMRGHPGYKEHYWHLLAEMWTVMTWTIYFFIYFRDIHAAMAVWITGNMSLKMHVLPPVEHAGAGMDTQSRWMSERFLVDFLSFLSNEKSKAKLIRALTLTAGCEEWKQGLCFAAIPF